MAVAGGAEGCSSRSRSTSAPAARIVVAEPGTLARSSGKLRRVYDLRDNG